MSIEMKHIHSTSVEPKYKKAFNRLGINPDNLISYQIQTLASDIGYPLNRIIKKRVARAK